MNPKEIAYERDARGVCIICQTADQNRRLGLCVKHYTRFRTTMRKMPAEIRVSFEAHLVESGLLMPRRQGPRVDPSEDVFADEARKYLDGVKATKTTGANFLPDPSVPRRKVVRQQVSDSDIAKAEQVAEHMVNHASEEPPIEKAPKKGRMGAKKKAQRRKRSEKLAERAGDVASDDGMPGAPARDVDTGSSPDESKGRAGSRKKEG